MPVMNGLQAATKIREGQQVGHISKSLLIAIISGDSLSKNSDVHKLFDKIFAKPINTASLRQYLARCF